MPKETHKTSVNGTCNDGACCCAGTQCFCDVAKVAVIHRSM
jgi:hypothetical protein